MLFYFIRHGETEANAVGVLAGSGIDHPLNPTGHSQAKALGERLKSALPGRVHRILASDMTRARETANYIARSLDLPLEIARDWREWHLGEWEGQRFEEYGHLILGDGEPQQGEARAVFYARVEQAWRTAHSDAEPYILVSHGAVWLALQDLLRIPRFKINNCALVEVKAVSGAWQARIL